MAISKYFPKKSWGPKDVGHTPNLNFSIFPLVYINKKESFKHYLFLRFQISKKLTRPIGHKTRMCFAFPSHAVGLRKLLSTSWSTANNILNAKRGYILFGFPRQMMLSESQSQKHFPASQVIFYNLSWTVRFFHLLSTQRSHMDIQSCKSSFT